MEKIPSWLIATSIFFNHLTCGPKGYSLCARFYENSRDGYKFSSFMVIVSDTIFFWDKNHCRKSWLMRRW